MKLRLSQINKQIGEKTILSDINLDIEEGEFIVILGPSGCGKTTLLRMIAGLEPIEDGQIEIDEKLVNQLPPRVRDVAMVFQNYSLYMHMTVWENLAFGLKTRKTPRQEIKVQVERVLDILKIHHLRGRKPGQLSGGEKQRVAIGRALVRNPKLYLFDEPLSNLDASLRMELRSEIKRIHKRFGNTSIYVTHDQVEAMSMADRLVVMDQGQMMQVGTTEEVYLNPQNTFVARFLGNPGMNLLPVPIASESGGLSIDLGQNRVPLSDLGVSGLGEKLTSNKEPIHFGFRPESARLSSNGEKGVTLAAKVALVERLGSETQLVMESPAGEFRIRAKERLDSSEGDCLTVHIAFSDIRLFSGNCQRVLPAYPN